MLLCLWCRPAAEPRIWPPAQELPYAVGAALKREKKRKEKKKKLISDLLEMEEWEDVLEEWERGIYFQGAYEILWVINVSVILIVVMVLCIYTYV